MAGFDRSFVYVLGAYGREANQADWKAGKDFHILHGPYFSIRDYEAMKAEGIEQLIFINRLQNVVWIENLL